MSDKRNSPASLWNALATEPAAYPQNVKGHLLWTVNLWAVDPDTSAQANAKRTVNFIGEVSGRPEC